MKSQNVPDVEAFRTWQLAGNRAVKIDLDRDGVSVWAYDYTLMVGQHVESVEEIDLEMVAVREARRSLARLGALASSINTEVGA